MTRKELVLLRGLPGSGKSSVAETIVKTKAGISHFEADMWFIDRETGQYLFDGKRLKDAHNWCKFVTEQAMSAGVPIVSVANTFTQEWEMHHYAKLANKYGYDIITLVVENRHGNESIHDVPDSSMDKMRERFELSL